MPKYTPKSPRKKARRTRPPAGSGAVIRGRYRYSLTRWWEPEPGRQPGRVAWVMLNPSTADALEDDPTVRRVRGFSEAWGFSEFEVVNLFAYRSSSPAHLWERRCDIVGPQNGDYLRAAVNRASRVVVAWGTGAGGDLGPRVATLVGMMRPHGVRAMCLGLNRDGSPKHPLYLRADTVPQPWPETASPSPLRSYSPPHLDRS